MDRHECHGTLRIVHLLVGIRQQRDILQERVERRIGMLLVEFADGVHHFVDVRDALVGSKFVILAQKVLVARIGDNAFGKNRERSLPRCQQILPALN